MRESVQTMECKVIKGALFAPTLLIAQSVFSHPGGLDAHGGHAKRSTQTTIAIKLLVLKLTGNLRRLYVWLRKRVGRSHTSTIVRTGSIGVTLTTIV